MKKIVVFFILSLFLFFSFNFAVAQDTSGTSQQDTSGTSKKTSTGDSLSNPLGDGTTPQKLIGRIINGVLGLVGSIALLMFVYGGFLWMTSSGNAEKVKEGKNIIIWAVLGMAIIFFAYALVKFVIQGVKG
ncbi:MAG: pilin [Planctomycetes bacterium]|jgi:amino acid transporter|nr:pilin [Planctomycetota bacterium]